MQSNTTKRSVSQVIFKHTPGSLISLDEHDVYGKVTEIKGEPDPDVNKKLLLKKMLEYANNWREKSDGRVRGFDEYLEPESLLPIRPSGVCYEVFPTTFECIKKDCKIIVIPESNSFTGKCPRCGSGLRQFKYVWFHNCGHIRSYRPITQINCPRHGKSSLYLNDTGRFKTSTWRCRECNYDKSLGMLPCTDEQCRTKRQEKEKYLQASVWNDPWVYFGHVISYINLRDQLIKPIVESQHKKELMLASLYGNIEAGFGRVLKKAQEDGLTSTCINCGNPLNPTAKFCSNCGAQQLAPADPFEEIKQEEGYMFEEESELVTLTVLRDLERTTSLKDKRRSVTPEKNIEKEAAAFQKLGIDDILLIQDFPLTYANIGFSRFQSKPPAWLRSFPAPPQQQDTKVRVYTNCVTTEAWLIQLSAISVLQWLRVNGLLPHNLQPLDIEELDENKAKLFIIQMLNSELENPQENGALNPVTELIHSMSHDVMHTLAMQSGLDIASLGELLLPSVLSFIIYAGESDLGGLTATFNQGLNPIASSLMDSFRSCKFDPSCSEDDRGACLGCLHIPRGCSLFNDKLSRAYLFGGESTLYTVKTGFFDLDNQKLISS